MFIDILKNTITGNSYRVTNITIDFSIPIFLDDTLCYLHYTNGIYIATIAPQIRLWSTVNNMHVYEKPNSIFCVYVDEGFSDILFRCTLTENFGIYIWTSLSTTRARWETGMSSFFREMKKINQGIAWKIHTRALTNRNEINSFFPKIARII